MTEIDCKDEYLSIRNSLEMLNSIKYIWQGKEERSLIKNQRAENKIK
jgi:hypothetical protein